MNKEELMTWVSELHERKSKIAKSIDIKKKDGITLDDPYLYHLTGSLSETQKQIYKAEKYLESFDMLSIDINDITCESFIELVNNMQEENGNVDILLNGSMPFDKFCSFLAYTTPYITLRNIWIKDKDMFTPLFVSEDVLKKWEQREQEIREIAEEVKKTRTKR
jgi:hypothetical protein